MTNLISIDTIKIAPNRQRREFDEAFLQELATSLSETQYGLMHPLVVREEKGETYLVAGERRLRAIKDIYALGGVIRHAGAPVPHGLIPVVNLSELDPLDAFEAELEENIRRRDLTMIEQAQATSRLFELRGAQRLRDGLPGVTTADLAREIYDIPADKPAGALGQLRDTVKNQLIVAKHAHNPEVAKASSLKEAVKIIKRAEDAKQNAILAEAVGRTFSAASHTLLHADCLDWLASAPPASFDLILTDPPYGMGADEFGDSGRGVDSSAHFYEDSYESWQSLMSVLPASLWRVTKPSAHAYIFCDVERFLELRARMSEAGWTCFRTPLIWVNYDGYRAPWPQYGPQRKYQTILYARRGDRPVNILAGDVIECRSDPALGHPAQKPVELLKTLLRRSARPGDRCLDPFAGSGSTLEACHDLKIACTAIEKDVGAYGIAVKRMQGFDLEEALP